MFLLRPMAVGFCWQSRTLPKVIYAFAGRAINPNNGNESCPASKSYATYAIGHVKHLLGSKMVIDVAEHVVIKYLTDRLGENAASKSINEEVGLP